MKNLKRVLSLALTGTMLAGMMTIGASAANKDFTDADEIQHTEAVNVMSTLGVLKGKDTGAFDPNTTVTRAEMAKIICVMLNGGNDPTLGSASSAMFSDINGHWARPYIEYCASMNIIAGQGDGTFAPDSPVTGAAAAKMLLVAMGYDSSIFEFTGADWEINVNRRANEAKLYEEIKNIDTSVGLSRDNTAQMAYNALEAKIMETTYDKVISSGEVSWSYGLSSETFLNKYFDAYTWVGTFTGNYNTGKAGTKGYIAVEGKLDTAEESKDGKYPTAKFPYDFDISNIGEEVKVLFKDGKSGTKGQPDKNDTIYGVFNTGRTEVVTAIKGDVKELKSTKSQIDIGGTKYDTKDEVTVITNYGLAEADKDATNGTSSKASDLTTALMGKTGDTIKAVTDPEDGKIKTVYVTESVIAAVTAKNSDKVSMNNGVGSIDIEDNEIYEDIKKGDVVVVTTLYADIDEDLSYTIVEQAEKVTGEVRSFKDKTNVKLGDETYKIHGAANMLNAIPDETVTVEFGGDDIGEEFDLYLINGYVGAAVMVSETASNYSVVTAVKTNGTANGVFDSLQLQVMDAEGTKSIITVGDNSKDTDGNKATDEADYNVGDIVVWSGKATDATVTIKASFADAAEADYNQKTKAFDGAVTTANCVLFAETSGEEIDNSNKDNGKYKFKAYSIRDLDSLDDVNSVYVMNGDKKVVAVFADLTKNAPGATDTTVYGIVTGYTGTTKVDGTAYYQYTAKNNEGEYNLLFSAKQSTLTGKLVSFEPVSDEIYDTDDVTVYTDGYNKDGFEVVTAYVKEYSESDKTLTIFNETKKIAGSNSYEGVAESQDTYALDSDCTIVYVNADDEDLGRDIGINGFDSVENWKNVAIVLSTDTKGNKVIVAIFVETSNKQDIL